MRKIALLGVSLLMASAIFAQKLTGTIRDDKGKGLNGATVTLLRAADSSTVKFTGTKNDGTFAFTAITDGEYILNATHVGYRPLYTGKIKVAGDTPLGDLALSTAAGDMKAVTVTSQKPMVEVKADKMIVNVEGTINAVGNDGLELLRKSPGVLVDKDENISLSGKNGVQVYIDGRPTPLAGKDLSDYLKSLQSANIEAIEIITNPSAKYEAAGNAGIINIRLKKNKSYGTNGSVNAGYNIGTFPKYNGGFSLNNRNKYMNVFGNYNYNHVRNANYMNMDRIAVNDTLFEQRSKMQFRNQGHNFKAGADYFINKQSTLGLIVNGNISDPTFTNYSRTLISYNPSKTAENVLIADNRNEMRRRNMNFNLNYRYADTSGREWNIDADHGFYKINSNQYQPNFTYTNDGSVKTGEEIYRMITPSDIDIYSFKTDYEQRFKGGKLGFGGKFSYVTSDNTFERTQYFGNVSVRDNLNNFKYEENINALYVNYNRQFKSFMVQAGLRAENTMSKGRSRGEHLEDNSLIRFDSTLDRSYTDFFPSAAVTFNKKPESQWNLTFSRRIDRPAYQDLNPFEFRLDKYAFMRGNTKLRPQYTNSFGLTHTYKYKLNTALNYSHVNDVFAQIVEVDATDSSRSFMTKRNIATQDIVSLNVSYPFQYKSFSSFINVNSYYSHYKEQNPKKNEAIDIDVVAVSIYGQNSLKFAKTWTAELSGWYNSPTVWQGTFKSKAMGGVDMGMQKVIFKGKGNVKVSVSDVFKTMRWSSISDYQGQYMKVWGGWESRQFRVAMSYRFGNNQVKAARQRNTGADEENKRVNSGGGGLGQ